MTKSKESPTIEQITLTPELAKEFMAKNVSNRPLRPIYVEVLSKAILNGEWMLTGDPIRFDWNGHLFDGQHRCQAVIATGVAIPTYVASGFDPKTQEVVDSGVKRSLGDTLHLRGEKSHNHLAAAINLMWRWDNSYIVNNQRNNPTRGQALAYLDEHPELRDAVRAASRLHGKIDISNTVIAACWYRFNQIDSDDCRDFWEATTTGFHLDQSPARPDSAPYALARYADRTMRGRHRTPSFVMHGVVVKAWNAYREGRSVKFLSFKAGGTQAEKFPEPV
jgi:hypothetical protein